MNKREKIIILLAVIAVVYGILDYFVFSSSKKEANEKMQSETIHQTSEILSKIDTNLLSLASMEKNKNKTDYMISMIESEWKNDPFTTPETSQEKLVEKPQGSFITGDTQEFIYSGFIQLGKKILVVINGMEYAKGDYIKDSGYKIFRITPDSVVLIFDENKQMVLHLKEG